MSCILRKSVGPRQHLTLMLTLIPMLFLSLSTAAAAGEYRALEGVSTVKVVFDVSRGSARSLPVVFWAVRNAYTAEAVTAVDKDPQVAVVFHGPAVKLLSTDREGFTAEEKKALDGFAEMIRQMKSEGVTFEVCLYAAKVMGVDPATFLPEIDPVGNGFISIIGYQSQGYTLVRIP